MSNKKHKAQDHIPIHDMNGNFVAFGHPGLLRKLSKVDRGFFQKSLSTLQTKFVLSSPATPENYPELIPFLKDNNVNSNVDNKTTSTSVPVPDTLNDLQAIKNVVTESLKEFHSVSGTINGVEIANGVEAANLAMQKRIKDAKNLPVQIREKLLYGDPPDTVSTFSTSTFGIDQDVPGADTTVIAEISYGPSKESKVSSQAEQKAYFAEFNARHRHLQNINVEVLKLSMGETRYIITTDYRGDITTYQYFKCHLRCDLTLAEYSDNLVFKDGEWKSVHVEKWLGTYHAIYTEWEDVADKVSEGVDNRAMHPENRKEIERDWQQFYHDLPIDAIQDMMGFDPKGLTDKLYQS